MHPIALLIVVVVVGGCGRIDFGDAVIDADLGGLVCDSTNPDLVGCWAFERDTHDGSQYHNDATSIGVTYVPGHDGLAVSTDATTQMLIADAPQYDGTTTLTLEAWLFLDAYPVGDNPFLFDDDQAYSMVINASGVVGAVVIGVSGNLYAASTAPVGLNAWHHVAFRYDAATTLDVLIDGSVAGFISSSGAGELNPTGTAGCRIAGDAGTVMVGPLQALIDDLRVWRVARADADL